MVDASQRHLLRDGLTFKLLCAALCFGLSGSGRGLDEGLIASTVAEQSFINEFHMHADYLSASQRANRLSNVTSMVHIGSLPGAVLAFILSERIGMLWTMRELCLMWIVGSVIFITSANNSIGQVYAGRFIIGLGLGQAGVVAPIYLAEVAPRRMRGMMVNMYGMSEYLGIVIGYFSIWGASIHISNSSAKQWVIPQSVQIMWAGILFLISFFCEESPRFLCKKDRVDDACNALASIWNLPPTHELVQTELRNTRIQLELEYQQTASRRWIDTFRELFMTAANLKRIAFVFVLQCLSQWSGPNSVTTYAPELFGIFGISGEYEKLLTTAVFGVVKLTCALVSALLLVDYLGRRKTLYLGLVIQIVALVYDSIFLTVYSNLSEVTKQAAPARHAAMGSVVMLFFVGVGWALGWNSVQYLITAELFPLRVRIVGSSLVTCWHYANRMGLSKVSLFASDNGNDIRIELGY
ncbi:hypothetical protein UA08_03684 [Talaromyces atroroseus]|uniref:Uncharacterized protein n=1 Tax=Talaromyces atroroseus TaxID=1441469 RepID=A0A225AST7_TALAT|nr:hypothetical protein UA08_03684 [Talaromyces atroroseus]OKL61414.1 hypothetical protein UA08_03684 [Talaromyces atroroseus]